MQVSIQIFEKTLKFLNRISQLLKTMANGEIKKRKMLFI